MSRVAYVNRRWVRHAEARVHVEDRGYQFADGVYEVWAVFDGRLADLEGHLARLERSLGELEIAAPMPRPALLAVLRETVRRNGVRDGMLYLQVTRGVARRDHAFPRPPSRPAVVMTAKPLDMAAADRRAEAGVSVITTPESRWARCDIKTVGLLPNALAKEAARRAGAYEAWFVDSDGLVTEGASTNAWILTGEGVLVTRDTGANILRGGHPRRRRRARRRAANPRGGARLHRGGGGGRAGGLHHRRQRLRDARHRRRRPAGGGGGARPCRPAPAPPVYLERARAAAA